MNEKHFDINPVIKYQTIARNLIVAFFAAVTVLAATGIWYSEVAMYWGVAAVLVITLGRLVVFAIEFKKAALLRFSLLSYLLALILLSTAVFKFLLK